MRTLLRRVKEWFSEARPTTVILVVLAAAGIPLLITYLLLARPSASSDAVDCVWSGTAHTWVDHNSNGEWDADELPLADVAIQVDDIANEYRDVGQAARTNHEGEASLRVWLPGCPRVTFEVYPVVPAGYRLTTDARLPVNRSGPFEFGFVEE